MNKNATSLTIALIMLISSLSVQGKTARTNNLITKTSVGGVKLEMTIAAARKVLKGLKLGPAPGDEGSTLIGVYEGEKLLLEIGYYDDADEGGKLPPIDENQEIFEIGILDARYKTADGIGPGMSIADAEKKYGRLKEMFNYPHEGEFGTFTNLPTGLQSTGLRFIFGITGEYSEAGIYVEDSNCPQDAYPPSCSKASTYNPGSYIAKIVISKE